MTFYADLHLHSKYARATSRDLDLEHLWIWAQRKGITLLGTGDFTHPAWMSEIKKKLVPAEPGLFRLNSDVANAIAHEVDPACRCDVRFMLSVEISTIYKKGDKTRKVHHLIYAPDLAAADRIIDRLGRIGNLTADGRPILGLDSRDLLEIVLECGPDTYLVPAHIWTPWFSAMGSKSGFDSIAECYGDLAEHIFAVETGLSSDPEMNWRISALDRYRLVSNSDAHSPGKLGREATLFHTPLDYFAIQQALKTGDGFGGTVEFFPEEGKYHLDGHRSCGVRLWPEETRDHDGRCPQCGQSLTIGVLNRVEELADRPLGARPDQPAPHWCLIPLQEVLSEILQVGPSSQRVQQQYHRLLHRTGSELSILRELPAEAFPKDTSELLIEGLCRMRQGNVVREGGYDGEYGTIRLFSPDELTHRIKGKTISLFDEPIDSSKVGATQQLRLC